MKHIQHRVGFKFSQKTISPKWNRIEWLLIKSNIA